MPRWNKTPRNKTRRNKTRRNKTRRTKRKLRGGKPSPVGSEPGTPELDGLVTTSSPEIPRTPSPKLFTSEAPATADKPKAKRPNTKKRYSKTRRNKTRRNKTRRNKTRRQTHY